MTAPHGRRVAFVGHGLPEQPSARAAAAWATCQQYMEREVAGVFFAPLEGLPEADRINRRIVDACDAAQHSRGAARSLGLPVSVTGPVRLDRHRQSPRRLSRHRASAGARCRAYRFSCASAWAPTVQARRAGYREALAAGGVRPDSALELEVAPTDLEAFASELERTSLDAIVCVNDRLAAEAMRTLLTLGPRRAGDVRLIGFDDADFAQFLPVPLTTVRQPTRQIGVAAAAAMMERHRAS